RDERKRRLRPPQLLEHDLLRQRVEPAAAVLARPAGRQPAIATHAPQRRAKLRAALAAAGRGAQLRGHERLEVGAELAPQALLLRSVGHVHARQSPAKAAMPRAARRAAVSGT